MADLLGIARKLEALAAQGLAFDPDPYDHERYGAVAALAEDLFHHLGYGAVEPATAPRERALREWFATPKVDTRGAAFDDRGRVLLVREVASGRWTLPGGWAGVGLTPSQAVASEFREEAGWDVEVVKLALVHDRNRHNTPPHRYAIYKLLFVCALEGRVARRATASDHETDAVAWFDLDGLPDLDVERTSAYQLQRLAAHAADTGLPTEFD